VIVYIESNFIFELGLNREQREHCLALLDWCEAGYIDLRLAAFAIPEARRALRKREADRLDTVRMLKFQSGDSKRHSTEDVATIESAREALQSWTDREAEQINDVMRRLLYGRVTFISLDRAALHNDEIFRAVKVLPGDGDLLIFACVMTDLVLRRSTGDTATSLFVTGGTDFLNAKIHFKPYSCDLLTSYSAAVGRLKAQLE
jgi:hypothetical protein